MREPPEVEEAVEEEEEEEVVVVVVVAAEAEVAEVAKAALRAAGRGLCLHVDPAP